MSIVLPSFGRSEPIHSIKKFTRKKWERTEKGVASIPGVVESPSPYTYTKNSWCREDFCFRN